MSMELLTEYEEGADPQRIFCPYEAHIYVMRVSAILSHIQPLGL
jgi:hypothetical protein